MAGACRHPRCFICKPGGEWADQRPSSGALRSTHTTSQTQGDYLQVGVNDLKTIALFPERRDAIVGDCEANIQQIVELSLNSGAQVILTTIFMPGQLTLDRRPFWSSDVIEAIAKVNLFISSLHSERVTVLDTANILSNGTEETNPAYTQDFLHLNATGYALLNRELRQVLPELLSTAGVGG
ncbi:MAG: hypothetical protein HY326_01140 [Chloroflexi bacterium]|nr:hypothetical protein [Chloroflexota bacterium]